jgi:hypothetical protein
MSEEKLSYMEQLNVWIHQTVVDPLLKAARSPDTAEWNRTRDAVYKAIREKALESYKNGLKAGAVKATSQPARKEPSHAQAKTR